MSDAPRTPVISIGLLATFGLAVILLVGARWILGILGLENVHPLSALLALPALVAIGVLIVLPVMFWASAVKRRRYLERESRGLCSDCGYDLRGIRHDRCPECGALVIRRRDPVTGKELD